MDGNATKQIAGVLAKACRQFISRVWQKGKRKITPLPALPIF
jgi:hypothetical protein